MTVSSAALCSIQVSKDVLEKDIVVALLLQLTQLKTHQVQVTTTKGKKNVLSMSVGVADNNGNRPVLTQRNAILRSLVGAALHGALDKVGEYLGLAGGGTFGSCRNSCSAHAALSAASLTQWMSVADGLYNNNKKKNSEDGSLSTLLAGLEQVLQESAYVLPYAATCTLADLDLAVALSKAMDDDDSQLPPAVMRWYKQVTAVLQQLASETGVALPDKLFALAQPSPATAPPVFFYGSEDADQVLDALYSSKQATSSDLKKSKKQQQGGKKEQQQHQGGQDMKQEGKKKEAKKKGGGDTPAAPANYDITALDIRVGKIVRVWPHETADKLYCEEIDLGQGEIRQIASGLRPFYKQSADLQDRVVLVLCNLKKRNLVGFPSHGMVLCASNADHTAVELVVPPEGSVLGERVGFDGLDTESSEPEPENKVAKKKIFEQLAPDLKTDADGNVVWKEHAAKTSAGAVQALNKMANASVS